MKKAIDQFLPIDGHILNVNTQKYLWDYNCFLGGIASLNIEAIVSDLQIP